MLANVDFRPRVSVFHSALDHRLNRWSLITWSDISVDVDSAPSDTRGDGGRHWWNYNSEGIREE
jgi:hypothetical protein